VAAGLGGAGVAIVRAPVGFEACGASGATCTRDGGATATWFGVTSPPGAVGQPWKPNVPGITVSGTTSAATNTSARGMLAIRALAILIRRLYRHL
jgi:hypothetical protein